MQSRVYAQAGVITILLTTMIFREYMDSHGRFPEPGEKVTLKGPVDADALILEKSKKA